MFSRAVSPTQLLSLYLRLAQGVHRDAQGAGDHLHLAADTGSELLEASWDTPELELKMDTGIATAHLCFPSNPKLKKRCFFCFFFSLLGSIGIPPSTEGPDGAVTQLKLGGGEEGKGVSAKELA